MNGLTSTHRQAGLTGIHQKTSIRGVRVIVHLLVISLFCLAVSAQAEVLEFDGTYGGQYGDYDIDIPFTIRDNSVVDITQTPGCRSGNGIYLRTGDLTDITDDQATSSTYNIAISLNGDPIEGYPLHAGDYIVRMTCRLPIDDENPTWNLSVNADPVTLAFASPDKEPPSMDSTAIARSTSFTGWLGFWGKPDDPVFTQDNLRGQDVSDYRLYTLTQGTRVKFRATWESFTSSTDVEKKPVTNVRIERYQDGKTYFVTNFDLLENSGDTTREIVLQQDGVYKITAIDVSYGDAREYRAYKIEVIVNGTTEISADINGIESIATEYQEEGIWSVTDALVFGWESEVHVSISNPSSEDINATLVYALSVRSQDPVIVGTGTLTLAANSSERVFRTFLTTPADMPISLTGQLIVMLYDETNTLLDTFSASVKLWGPNHLPPLALAPLILLLD